MDWSAAAGVTVEIFVCEHEGRKDMPGHTPRLPIATTIT